MVHWICASLVRDGQDLVYAPYYRRGGDRMCRVMCLHVLLLSTFDLHNALYFGSLIFHLVIWRVSVTGNNCFRTSAFVLPFFDSSR